MYYKITCTHCEKSLKVREENLGRKVKCPFCHHYLMVNAPSAPPTQPAAGGGAPASPESRRERPDLSRAAPQRSDGSTVHEWTDGTNVSMLLSLLIAISLTVAIVLILLPFKDTYVGKLFLDRGWVQFALIFLLSWSVGMLILKWRKVTWQKESMLFDMLPNEVAEDITVRTVDKFTQHIRALPADARGSFLINRVLRGLEHFRVRRNASEVASIMTSQSDIDANSVESSYSLIKVFIWAIPILGFIGTVIGISNAVGGFSGNLSGAGELDQLKDSLFTVTEGLATAFDTTLVALVMSILVMFPVSSMQKAEEDLLNWVDEYCNENLIKRLKDSTSGDDGTPGKFDVNDTVQRAIDAALAGKQGAMMHQLNELQENIARLQSDQVEKIDGAMTDLSHRTASVQEEVASNMLKASDSLRNYFVGLEHGLDSLNSVLTRLGEKQVVIQQEAPAKRGWFRRNNRG